MQGSMKASVRISDLRFNGLRSAKAYPKCRHLAKCQQQQQPVRSSNVSDGSNSVAFPQSYDQALRQAQESVKAALSDGCQLIEVEFPSTSLSSVQGDGEGANEMSASMGYLRQFAGAFREKAQNVRIFWPDDAELAVAKMGQKADMGSGRSALEGTFNDGTGGAFKMGYLTKQNALWAAVGVNFGLGEKFSPVKQVQDSDQLFMIAYPHFNPREELGAVFELYQQVAQPRALPIIIFNGELDRVRGGYYPSLFFSELARLTREFIPRFTQAYYIHNFKGTRPGALFRAYPGPWCVLRRNPLQPGDMKVIYTSETMPSLRQVALEILPNM